MNVNDLIEQIKEAVSQKVIEEIVKLPQMTWIQWQVDAWNYSTWHAQVTERARELAEIIHNHYGLELTPEEIVVSVGNDRGDRTSIDFIHSLIHDRRHLGRWVATFEQL
jgi:hypothetical protein